jgi:hypothetical protein
MTRIYKVVLGACMTLALEQWAPRAFASEQAFLTLSSDLEKLLIGGVFAIVTRALRVRAVDATGVKHKNPKPGALLALKGDAEHSVTHTDTSFL